MYIETKRLILKKMNVNDFDFLCSILKNPNVMYAYEHAFSDDEVKSWLKKQLNSYFEHNIGLLKVILKETNEEIGQCGITIQNINDTKVYEIGYLFKEQFWHNGYATESAAACKDYAFNNLNINEIFSIIRDTNKKSQNVAKRIGMTFKGEFIKHYYNIDMLHFIYSICK